MDNYVLEIDDPLVQHGLEECIGSSGEVLDVTKLTNCKDCGKIILCSGVGIINVRYHQCHPCLLKECEES